MIARIIGIVRNGLHTNFIQVLMFDEVSEYRSGDFVLPDGKVLNDHLDQILTGLWSSGNPASIDDWIEAEQVLHRDYYKSVLRAIMVQHDLGSDLAATNTFALAVMTGNQERYDEFAAIMVKAELPGQDIGDHRDLLAMIQSWCLAGLAVGDGE